MLLTCTRFRHSPTEYVFIRKFTILTLAIAATLTVPASLALGRTSGVFAGGGSSNRALPGCGACHSSRTPGNVNISLSSALALKKDATVDVSLGVTGPSGSTGGFSMDSSTGEFQAGTRTRVSSSRKNETTHRDKDWRSWTFKFKGTVTGLVKWYATAMASNGSGTSGDRWGYWGPDTSKPGTPYRLFVSDTQVTPFGDSGAGTLGLKPVVGIAKNVTSLQTYTMEVHNVKPNAIVLYILGFSNKLYGAIPLPFDLGLIGAPGNKLYASMDLTLAAVATGTGDGGGSASWSLPIPNGYKGVKLYHQAMVLDNVNSLGLITSMALESTIQ